MKHRRARWNASAALLATACAGATLHADTLSEVGEWSGVLDWPIEAIHSVMLPTGKVMVWQTWTDSIALWDPTDGSFTDAANPNVNIFCSGHAWLPDGRLLVVGGHISNFNGEEETNIYDPWTDTWANDVPDMNALNGLPDNQAGRWYPAVTSMGNGEVLTLAGDMTQVSVNNPLPQLYNPTTNSWRDLNTAIKTDLSEYPRTFLAPDGRAFVVSDYSDDSYFLDTTGTGKWSFVDDAPAPNLHNYGPGVMYDTGKIAYFGGGHNPTANISTIDLNDPNPAWQTPATMAQPRRQNDATILADGTVLITGGSSQPGFNEFSGNIALAEVWDPDTNTVTPVADASSVYRGYHSTATLLPDGRVLITGGDHDHGGFTQNLNAEIYSPSYLFKGARPTVTSAPTTATLGDTIFVETPDAASITKALIVVPGATTHAQNWTQRASVLDFSVTANGLNIEMPVDGNAAPPGKYMLFLVNDQGVPSVAEWLFAELDPSAGSAKTFNLLSNGGFEGGGAPKEWGTFGNTLGNVRSNSQLSTQGEQALKLYGQYNGQDNYSGAAQGVAVTEGATIRLEASAQTPSFDTLAGTSNEVWMKLEFFSVFGGAYGSEDFLGEVVEVIIDGTTPEDLWIDHVLETVVPTGAVEARAVFLIRQTNNQTGAGWIDNVTLTVVTALAGDYNDDGSVDQGDLDLVLLNWGEDASVTGAPAGWVNAQPTGLIGQNELDGVLLNWGGTAEPNGGAVPEPTSLTLLGLGSLALIRRRLA